MDRGRPLYGCIAREVRESGETALICYEANDDLNKLQGFQVHGLVHIGCIGPRGGSMILCHPYRATDAFDAQTKSTVYWGLTFDAVAREVMASLFETQCRGSEQFVLRFLLTIGAVLILPTALLADSKEPVAVHSVPAPWTIDRLCFIDDEAGPPNYCPFIFPRLPVTDPAGSSP